MGIQSERNKVRNNWPVQSCNVVQINTFNFLIFFVINFFFKFLVALLDMFVFVIRWLSGCEGEGGRPAPSSGIISAKPWNLGEGKGVDPTGDRSYPPWNHPPPPGDTGTELPAVDSRPTVISDIHLTSF